MMARPRWRPAFGWPCTRDLEQPVGSRRGSVEIAGHGAASFDVETVIGHFVDASWAYRFGPPAQDAIVASLVEDTPEEPELLSQAFLFPAGWPLTAEPERRLGLSASARQDSRRDASSDR